MNDVQNAGDGVSVFVILTLLIYVLNYRIFYDVDTSRLTGEMTAIEKSLLYSQNSKARVSQ